MNQLSIEQQVRLQIVGILGKERPLDELDGYYKFIMGEKKSILPVQSFTEVKQ